MTAEARDIAGFPGYRVDAAGTVWSCWVRGPRSSRRGVWRPLKAVPVTDGYLQVGLYRDGRTHHRLVHRLVLEAFVGPCPAGMECRHFPDRNPANNRLENLRWGTPLENSADQRVHGTARGPRGEESGTAKLTDDSVRTIRRLYAGGTRATELARRFGVDRTTIWRAVTRKQWVEVVDAG